MILYLQLFKDNKFKFDNDYNDSTEYIFIYWLHEEKIHNI